MTLTTETPPYFHALAAFACKKNRLYRIYICRDELVFIWAGSGIQSEAHVAAAGVAHGPLGALLAFLFFKAIDPTKKNAARKEVLDYTPLEQLLDDHPKNFRAFVEDFEEVCIGPYSHWHAFSYGDYEHQAMLYLRHRDLGKYRLGIATLEDFSVAVSELPRVFGEKCRIKF